MPMAVARAASEQALWIKRYLSSSAWSKPAQVGSQTIGRVPEHGHAVVPVASVKPLFVWLSIASMACASCTSPHRALHRTVTFRTKSEGCICTRRRHRHLRANAEMPSPVVKVPPTCLQPQHGTRAQKQVTFKSECPPPMPLDDQSPYHHARGCYQTCSDADTTADATQEHWL